MWWITSILKHVVHGLLEDCNSNLLTLRTAITNPYPPVHRPGISENILISAGIRYCDYPEPESIKIPYWTRDGDITQWCRYWLKNVRDTAASRGNFR